MKKYLKTMLAFLIVAQTVFAAACRPSKEPTPTPGGGVTVEYTDIKLADAGKTDYTIVIPTDADDCVQYAAEELKKYFKESTTANIDIQTDNGKHFDSNVKYISLGNTTLKNEAGITNVSKKEVNLDGFKLITKNNSMFVVGYESRGILYGVYSLMGYMFGYECYAVDEIALDYETTEYLPDLNVVEAPSFEGRWMDGPISRYDYLASNLGIKHGFNTSDTYYGGSNTDEWLFGRTSHCEWGFFRDDGYINRGDRPEILTAEMKALNDQHLCWTNAEVIDLVVERAIKELQAQPTALYVNFTEEDNATYCNCNRAATSYCGMGCKESAEKYGSSGLLIRFVNEIIKKIEAWREVNCPERDIKYSTMAYAGTLTPPVKTDENGETVPIDESCVPHEKLYIRYTPLGRCMLHAFYDQSCTANKAKAASWEAWKKITNGRLMVYDYYANYDDYYTFFNNYNVVQDELIEYYEAGVINYMAQYTSGANFSTMSDLNSYLFPKLMWNVYEDSNKLIENFMNAYYKDGAPYMMEYFNLMRTHINNKEISETKFHMTTYTDAHAPYYNTDATWPKAVLEKALSLIEQADKAYDKIQDNELREKLKSRVLKESFCVRFTILKNYGKYYSYTAKEYAQFKAQWEVDAAATVANYWSEGSNGTIASFIAALPKAAS